MAKRPTTVLETSKPKPFSNLKGLDWSIDQILTSVPQRIESMTALLTPRRQAQCAARQGLTTLAVLAIALMADQRCIYAKRQMFLQSQPLPLLLLLRGAASPVLRPESSTTYPACRLVAQLPLQNTSLAASSGASVARTTSGLAQNFHIPRSLDAPQVPNLYPPLRPALHCRRHLLV